MDAMEEISAEVEQELANLVAQAHQEIVAVLCLLGDTVDQMAKNPAYINNYMAKGQTENETARRANQINIALLAVRSILVDTLGRTYWKPITDFVDEGISHKLMHDIGVTSEEVCEKHHEKARQFAKELGAISYDELVYEVGVGMTLMSSGIIDTVLQLNREEDDNDR